MRVALLATASPEVIRSVTAEARRFFEGRQIVIYLREAWHAELAEDLAGCELRADTLRGRWFRFWRSARRERFDSIAVIWAGGRDHWKLKLMGLLLLPRNLYVFNENANFFRIGKGSLGILRSHLGWRLVQALHKAPPATRREIALPWALRAALRLYALSVGPFVGLLILLGHASWLEGKQRFRQACAELRERDGAARP